MIKADAAHYTEAEAVAVMICLASLAAVLSGDAQKNHSPQPIELTEKCLHRWKITNRENRKNDNY